MANKHFLFVETVNITVWDQPKMLLTFFLREVSLKVKQFSMTVIGIVGTELLNKKNTLSFNPNKMVI